MRENNVWNFIDGYERLFVKCSFAHSEFLFSSIFFSLLLAITIFELMIFEDNQFYSWRRIKLGLKGIIDYAMSMRTVKIFHLSCRTVTTIYLNFKTWIFDLINILGTHQERPRIPSFKLKPYLRIIPPIEMPRIFSQCDFKSKCENVWSGSNSSSRKNFLK